MSTLEPGLSGTANGSSLADVNSLFACLGQVLLCLDEQFCVVHASHWLDRIAGRGAAERATGQPAEELLGRGLFGPGGVFRLALNVGERREGWRTHLRLGGRGQKLVSVSAAPLSDDAYALLGDLAVRFVVALRVIDGAAPSRAVPTVFCGMVARSAVMLKLFRLIEGLEASTAAVLVTGESGTGKELVARAVHRHSPRRDGPFVAVNCGALPEALLESELFGHVRGAFTGAQRSREGRFEAASHGTLFLDEIADLPRHLQAKLLRVLQERTFERLGESTPRRTDARIIAAANVDLRTAVRLDRLREDLYYRLRVVTLELPPLRDRIEDVEPLATFLLARIAARDGRDLKLSPDTLGVLLRHSWPGNVRELENALEHAAAVTRGPAILPEDLPAELVDAPAEPQASLRPAAAGDAAAPAGEEAPAAATDGDGLSEGKLRAALDAHRWRRRETARALGVSRTTLWRRMRELGWLD